MNYDPATDPARKEVTYQEIIEAIRKNGLPQHFQDYFKVVNGKVIAACALGQAAINLGVAADSLSHELEGCSPPYVTNEEAENRHYHLDDEIFSWNDEDKLILSDIADMLESKSEFSDKKFYPTKQDYSGML